MVGVPYGCWGPSKGSLGRCRGPYMDGGSLYRVPGVPTSLLCPNSGCGVPIGVAGSLWGARAPIQVNGESIWVLGSPCELQWGPYMGAGSLYIIRGPYTLSGFPMGAEGSLWVLGGL